MNLTSSQQKIYNYIVKTKQTRVANISKSLNYSTQFVHRKLKELLQKGVIEKYGSAPIVYYTVSNSAINIVAKQDSNIAGLPDALAKLIDDNYLYVSPIGEILFGMAGFKSWTYSTNQQSRMLQLAKQYGSKIQELSLLRNSIGVIDASAKIKNTFPKMYLNSVFYIDFFSIPVFGKTKLGQLVLYAKQSQNREIIVDICNLVNSNIRNLIDKYQIDSYAIIPPTIHRKLQFLDAFDDCLNLSVPKIALAKVSKSQITVAQKTLSKLSERVLNAKESIFIKNTNGKEYHNTLLIDDAVGSGASLNETAKKLKEMHITKNVFGLGIVGSYKGFEVINEV